MSQLLGLLVYFMLSYNLNMPPLHSISASCPSFTCLDILLAVHHLPVFPTVHVLQTSGEEGD